MNRTTRSYLLWLVAITIGLALTTSIVAQAKQPDASSKVTISRSMEPRVPAKAPPAKSPVIAATPEFSIAVGFDAPAGCPGDHEPNETFAAAWAITPGSLQDHICDANDKDWYKFPVTSGELLQIDLTNLPVDYDIALYAPDDDTASVAQSSYFGLGDEQIVYRATKTGDYRILVYGYRDAFDASNAYTLTLTEPTTATNTPTPTPSPTPTVTPTIAICPDTHEPNESFAAAWAIVPGSLQDYICHANDQDWYKFALTPGQWVQIDLTSLPADYDLYLYAPDNDTDIVARSTFSGRAYEQIIFRVSQTGDYRIKVIGYRGASHAHAPYTLSLAKLSGLREMYLPMLVGG